MYVTLAIKVTKGHIHDGSISQNELHMVYNVCVQFHVFIENAQFSHFL